jgi:hypothetical protein
MVQSVNFSIFFWFLNPTVILKRNNPYKLKVGFCFMDEERYYLVEKIKNRFMVDAFNMNVIIRQEGENLKMLSSKAIKPKEIGVSLEKGVISCTDNHYKLKEVTKEKALKTLKDMDVNYSCWQEYMSSSEDRPSSHLSHGGESLI